MGKNVVEVQVRAVVPTSGGSAVFLGNADKAFVIYIDTAMGHAITMFMRNHPRERPLTHDLITHLLTALGAHVDRVIINDLQNGTYFARIILSAENEVMTRKLIEIDARPSDCIAMAVQQKSPIYIAQKVWEEVEDMSEVLQKMDDGEFTVGDEPAPE